MFGVRSLGVMREVGCFDVVLVVVLRVVNFPTFFVRYPFVDSADESVDGGVVDEVRDEDRVSFFDRAFLSGREGTFGYVRFGVLIGCVVRLGGVLSVANALSDAIGRVL